MKPLELDILWIDDETMRDVEMGIKKESLRNAGLVSKTFITIGFIEPYEVEGTDMCLIGCNGDEYICPLTHKEVKQLIEDNL
jgi:hypothetical protein